MNISKHKDPTTAEARKTSMLVGGVLVFAALVAWYRGRLSISVVAGSIAGILIVVGLAAPPLAKLFHRAWMRFAFALGYVNSRIILTVIYFVAFVPYGVISRLAGRDPLQLRQKAKKSYWTPRTATRQSKEQFERLF